jgi:hypothetical protein
MKLEWMQRIALKKPSPGPTRLLQKLFLTIDEFCPDTIFHCISRRQTTRAAGSGLNKEVHRYQGQAASVKYCQAREKMAWW